MVKHIKKFSKKAGLKPGTVVHIGERKVETVKISVIDYDQTNHQTLELKSIEECFPYKETLSLTWIDICGLHDVELIAKLGHHFGLHDLVLEDIANTGQRPKIEEADDYIFIVLKMLYHDNKTGELVSEQVSLVFGTNFLLSFQEKEGDVFDNVRQRIEKTVPRVRFLGTDYLAYALMDAVIDHYFIVLENDGEKIEALEEDLVTNPKREDIETIHEMKRELLGMRRRIWPLREVVGGLERSESPLIHDYTKPYVRDLYEHVVQVIDTVETFREMVSGLLDIYLSSISNRMNEVMKVLTIIATIFIPLGFLAGIYGMNFDTSVSPFNMPELGLKYGYLLFWLVALAVGGGLVMYFRKRKWL
ncbi:MAG: magnesium/cobalt transporter CorA [Candidatus Zixiibacteriota bacterium]